MYVVRVRVYMHLFIKYADQDQKRSELVSDNPRDSLLYYIFYVCASIICPTPVMIIIITITIISMQSAYLGLLLLLFTDQGRYLQGYYYYFIYYTVVIIVHVTIVQCGPQYSGIFFSRPSATSSPSVGIVVQC